MFWSDPGPGVLVESGRFGQIRIRVSWSDLDVLVGSDSRCFGQIRVFWSDSDTARTFRFKIPFFEGRIRIMALFVRPGSDIYLRLDPDSAFSRGSDQSHLHPYS